MAVFADNLLTLCEQTLILCLEKFKKDFPIVVVEIAESDRTSLPSSLQDERRYI